MAHPSTAPRQLNSYDEWTTLREVVVGTATNYRKHFIDTSFGLFYFENIYSPLAERRARAGSPPAQGPYRVAIPREILDELTADLEGFVAALEGCGVTVTRPQPSQGLHDVVTPYWASSITPALNVRDQALILGNCIVETAPHVRARIFENDLLKPMFYDYFSRGCSWISMPRPALAKESLDPSYFTAQGMDVTELLADRGATALASLGFELIFDGAQCIRLGRDVLVNVANANHELGFTWLSRTFADRFRFHRLERMADNHVDSIIMPLRPGLLLLRSPEYRRYLPSGLQTWDVVYPPEVSEARFPAYGADLMLIASKYVDMNVLSVDEHTVIANSLYPELIGVLEARGLDVVPVRHRHRRLFGGGFHCFTLDCVREGGPEAYLDA